MRASRTVVSLVVYVLEWAIVFRWFCDLYYCLAQLGVCGCLSRGMCGYVCVCVCFVCVLLLSVCYVCDTNSIREKQNLLLSRYNLLLQLLHYLRTLLCRYYTHTLCLGLCCFHTIPSPLFLFLRICASCFVPSICLFVKLLYIWYKSFEIVFFLIK